RDPNPIGPTTARGQASGQLVRAARQRRESTGHPSSGGAGPPPPGPHRAEAMDQSKGRGPQDDDTTAGRGVSPGRIVVSPGLRRGTPSLTIAAGGFNVPKMVTARGSSVNRLGGKNLREFQAGAEAVPGAGSARLGRSHGVD